RHTRFSRDWSSDVCSSDLGSCGSWSRKPCGSSIALLSSRAISYRRIGMADQNIGAARVHLVVDATDWDSTLAQARNAAAQFGTDAERAFDRTEGGVRRAATRLLDYAASLGRVDTQMERYIRNASRAGVEEPIIRAAIARWEEYQKEITATTAALEEAARIDKAFDQARAQAAQRTFNVDYG